MKHLSIAELSAHLDRALTGRALEDVERHLAGCAACRAALDDLAAQDRSLAEALVHDPGEAYFESFLARVENRLHAEAVAGEGTQSGPAGSDAARGGGFFGWLGTPRGLAIAGSVAAVVVGAGVVLITARESGLSDLRRPEIVRHSKQVAGGERSEANRVAPPAEAPGGRVHPDESAESGGRPGSANAPSDAAGPGRRPASTTARAIRVRRGPSGEEIRSPRPPGFQFAQPPGAAPPAPAAPANTAPTGPIPEGPAKPRPAPVTSGLPPGSREGMTSPPEIGGRGGMASPPETGGKGGMASPPETGSKEGVAAPLEKEVGRAETAREELAASRKDERERKTDGQAPRIAPPSYRQEGEAQKLGVDSDVGVATSPRGRLCGQVLDASDRPVAGANVALAESGATASTGADGRFCLDASAGRHALIVLSVGFQPLRLAVTVAAGTTETTVTLHPVIVFGGLGTPMRGLGFALAPATRESSAWPVAARDAALRAEGLSDRAARLQSPASFDSAALEWTQALEQSRGSRRETEAWRRLSDARYRAWEIAPTRERAAAAARALEGYRNRAPLGAERDDAARRLERVKR